MGLSEEDRIELAARIPSGKYDGSISSRARIILLWDDGSSKREIAEEMETSVVTVAKWIDRYEQGGIAALESVHSSRGFGLKESLVAAAWGLACAASSYVCPGGQRLQRKPGAGQAQPVTARAPRQATFALGLG